MTHPSADLNFAPAPVEIKAGTATPEAVAAGITANQQQMQKVNDLSRGGSARSRSRSRSSKKVKSGSRRRRHIRTYRRRGRQQQQQNGGAAAAAGAITIPQAPGQATCSEGPQCAGAQNANLTSVLNQAKSSGANDGYAGGGKKRTRNSQKRRKSQRRQ